MESPRQSSSLSLAVFATFLVVIGITLIVQLSSFRRMTSGPSTPTIPSSDASSSTSPALWLVNETGLTILHLNGKIERLSSAQAEQRFAGSALPLEGADAASGASVHFHFSSLTSSTALLSPDGQMIATLNVRPDDAVSAIELHSKEQQGQLQEIRLGTGRPVKEVELLGWFDDKSFALSGSATDTKWLYALDLREAVRPLIVLPDNVIYLAMHDGAVWYATATLGEGLESAPKGPSELHRVTVDGKDVRILRDEKHVVLNAISGPLNHLAWTLDDGQSWIMKMGDEASRFSLGKRRPLLFLPDGRLVIRDGFDLSLYDPTKQVVQRLGSLPEGRVEVFVGM